MKRSNRCTLALLVGGGVAAVGAVGLLARPSSATLADTTCPADVIATLTNVSQTTVPVGVTVVRSFTLLASYAVSAVHLSAPDGYNATQVDEPNGAYGLRLTAPRAGAFAVQATWSETYMVDNPDGTNSQATCNGAGSVTLTAVRPAGVAPASSKLPAAGDWRYDQVPTSNTTGKYAVFDTYLRVSPGKSSVYAFSVVIIGGTCKKAGRTMTGSLVGGSSARTLIPVKPDGSFSGARSAVGDEAGSKGTVRFKGVFNGIRVSGTVTAHMHYPVFGDCQGAAKFRGKGVRIG